MIVLQMSQQHSKRHHGVSTSLCMRRQQMLAGQSVVQARTQISPPNCALTSCCWPPTELTQVPFVQLMLCTWLERKHTHFKELAWEASLLDIVKHAHVCARKKPL
jgi:hypothetical protein